MLLEKGLFIELVDQLTPRPLCACILSLDGILYQGKWDHMITEDSKTLMIYPFPHLHGPLKNS